MEELWSRYSEKAVLVFFPGGKSPGHEADHSFPSRLQIKNEWISASTPHVFMECKGRI